MGSNNVDDINKLNDEYEDRLFRLVMKDVSTKEGKILLEENELLKDDPQFAPSQDSIKEFEKLLNAELSKSKKNSMKVTLSRIIKRTMAAMLVLVIVFSLTMVSVKAFRVKVFNFLINIQSKYTSYELTDGDDSGQSDGLAINWTNAYVPTYIPQGYEVTNVVDSDIRKQVVFTKTNDESGNIIYCEYNSINSIAVDTENASMIEKVDVNGMNGTLSVKESMVTVAWEMEGHLFTVQGQISNDEIIKIAEGVKFKK